MTTDQPLGEILRDDGRIGVRFVRELSHTPEKVWAAITESDHLRHWMPCDIVGDRRAGAEITLPFWPAQIAKYDLDDEPLHGHIEAWDPPSLFVWTWAGDHLRFELEPLGAGTRLTFTTWFESPDPAGAVNAGAGYHTCLDALRELLDTGTARPLDDADADTKRLEKRYAHAMDAPH